MSKETLEQFMNQVAGSEELQSRIGEDIHIDSLIALGAEHGCEFSGEDLHHATSLSDEELDAVAGGVADQEANKESLRFYTKDNKLALETVIYKWGGTST